MTLKQTPIAKKLARLFLVSDILHNSSAKVPGASSFRTHFHATLPTIFESLHAVYAGLDSRMAIETFKDQVTTVLQIWQAWSMFPLSYTSALERAFLNGPKSADGPASAESRGGSGATDSESHDADVDVDGEPFDLDDGGPPLEPIASDVMGRLFAGLEVTTITVSTAHDRVSSLRSSDATQSCVTAPMSEPSVRESSGCEREVGDGRLERARSFSLRELEAVLEASGLDSSGSRSEMLTRLLEALRSGADVRMDARPVEQQTLAVASRWDADADGSEGGNATHASAVGEAGGSSASADLDGDEIDGEDIDGEAMEGSPSKAFPKGSTAPPIESHLSKAILREVETDLLRLSDSLEARGLSAQAISSRLADRRKELLLDAACRGGVDRADGGGRKGSSGGSGGSGDGSAATSVKGKARRADDVEERGRKERHVEGGRERDRSRSRSRSRGRRDRSRESGRSRERDRSRSRSRDRDRARVRDGERGQPAGRERDRDASERQRTGTRRSPSRSRSRGRDRQRSGPRRR